MAAFANAVMVRYLDANDTYISPINGTSHPSDMTPGILAVADAYGASWQDVVEVDGLRTQDLLFEPTNKSLRARCVALGHIAWSEYF